MVPVALVWSGLVTPRRTGSVRWRFWAQVPITANAAPSMLRVAERSYVMVLRATMRRLAVNTELHA